MLHLLVLAALFYVFVPGIFLSLPSGGSRNTMALVHSVLFVAAYYVVKTNFVASDDADAFINWGRVFGWRW